MKATGTLLLLAGISAASLSGCAVVPYEPGPVMYGPPPPAVVVVRPAPSYGYYGGYYGGGYGRWRHGWR